MIKKIKSWLKSWVECEHEFYSPCWSFIDLLTEKHEKEDYICLKCGKRQKDVDKEKS